MSTLTRKAWTDLRRRPARTVLTTCTLGLAIASLATVAVPGLMDRTMRDEVRAARLHDIAITTHDLALRPAQLKALGQLSNVAAFDARVLYSTRAVIGRRQGHAAIWGLDPGSQPVDTVRLTGGQLPRPGEVLTNASNGPAVDFPVAIGELVEVRDRNARPTPLRVSGTARSLATSPEAVGPGNAAVFYASADTVRSLAGVQGVNWLGFRLVQDSPEAEDRTIAAIHAYLKAQTGREPFVDLADSRRPGDWPGSSVFHQISSLLYVITVLAVVCALFLIANTMNTLVAEQAGEIAILKTLGGRRRQIASVFLRTAALLGGVGGVLGAGVGAAIAYLLTRYFATTIFDVRARFAISVPVVLVSITTGPALAMAASLPALRRALRRSVAETLADQGGVGYGVGRLDRLVARSHLLSGPARLGVRNVLRQKRRSAATIAQIAVATATALALFAVGRSVSLTLSQVYGTLRYDLALNANPGSPALDQRARAIAAETPDVTAVDAVLENQVQYRGATWAALGFDSHPLYRYRLRAGRWLTAADISKASPAVVLGPAVARATHARVGQTLMLDTAAGPTEVHVIGIDTGQFANGGTVDFPLPVLQQLTGAGDTSNRLWLTTTSASHATVDRAAAAVEDRLAAAGYQVDTDKRYVQQANNRAQNNTLLTVIEVMGLLVAAITLIGLVSTLTMAVIERTREIAVLRSLGARARHIRRVFAAEGIVLATVGWAFGVPLGWLLSRALLIFIRHIFSVDVSAVFPAASIPIALIATVTITIIVIRPPLRRATHIQPSAALRYQ